MNILKEFAALGRGHLSALTGMKALIIVCQSQCAFCLRNKAAQAADQLAAA